ISSWPDSAGMNRGTTALTGTQPVFTSNVDSGLPGVTFGGGVHNGLATSIPGNGTLTAFGVVVFRAPMWTGPGALLGSASQGGIELQIAPVGIDSPPGAGNFNLVKESIVNIGSTHRSIPAGAHLLELTYSAGSGAWQMFLDGTLGASGTTTQTF